ncbi:GNAT family N-acetyltransferase [Williamwhitmania taraxaci]|uniref:Protein N-acetyltransferase, RimJ/RimL family n=1 Tax=Williamwhitmania taraxaci TaxID=1640674 RepID=A0A1G6GGJ4_9BACT|nr:GNAT family protein [Williamwhitmania taraxaci]SDB81152.1 Protein N-acetyltransferase, RimJ/RimL family [Williamwhitmania taraxaci]
MEDRVYLRAFEVDDYILINRWRRDPEIIKYLAGNVFFVSSEREKKSVENKIFDDSVNLYLGICEKNTNKLIGYTNINNIDLRNAKAEWAGTFIGDKDFAGQGYGREASILMLSFLFSQYPIHKCYGRCLEEHPTTAKLFISLGFTQDGVLRDDVFKNGEFKNVLMFSILRDEVNGQF